MDELGRVEVRMLGAFDCSVGGAAATLGGRKQRAVLAMLALRCGRVVSVDFLTAQLWGDEPPGDPVNAIQAHVSTLRRALAPAAALVNRPPGYLLDVDEADVDVFAFERLLETGRTRWAEGDAAGTAGVLREALDLWRGPALADLVDERFAGPEVARLDEERDAAAELLVDARLRLGEHTAVVGELERLTAASPLRERTWAQLMLALYRAGRQGDALRAYRRARDVLLEQLGIDPGPELRDLERAILDQDPSLDAPAPPALPTRPRVEEVAVAPVVAAPASAFHGRAAELAEVVALVAEPGIVTLTGAAGTGKTRLALEVAAAVGPTLAGGAVLVDLAAVAPGDVPGAIAAALGLVDVPAAPLDAVTARVRDLPLLLVLDTTEHLGDECAVVTAALAARCPAVRVVVASRRVLGSRVERVVHLAGLALPAPGADDAASVGAADSVRLFVRRARAATPAFELTDANAAAVARVVRAVDGLPLALELAAARTRVLSAEQLADRLVGRLDLLTTGDPSGEVRHRTLRAAIDWSHDLLGAEDALALAAASVFEGVFSLDGLEAVAGGVGLAPMAALDALQDLVEHSLVEASSSPTGRRYRLLETVREYAAERLEAGGRRVVAEDAHAGWAARLVLAPDAGSPAWVERVGEARADVRAGLARLAMQSDGRALAMAAPLGAFWLRAGALREGRRILEDLLDRPSLVEADPGGAAHAGLALATLLLEQGEVGLAVARAGAALSAFERTADRAGAAAALTVLARADRSEGDVERARRLAVKALERFRSLGDARGVAGATRELAIIERVAGDHARATALLLESLGQLDELRRADEARRGGAVVFARDRSQVLAELGRNAERTGDLDGAERLLRQGLAVAGDRANLLGAADALDGLAAVALAQGVPERAVLLSAAGDRLRTSAGGRITPHERLDRDRTVERARASLPASVVAELEARAASIDLADAIVLGEGGPLSARSQ